MHHEITALHQLMVIHHHSSSLLVIPATISFIENTVLIVFSLEICAHRQYNILFFLLNMYKSRVKNDIINLLQ